MSIQDIAGYVKFQKELLALEREEEKKESLSFEDGHRLSELETSGVRLE